MPTSLKSANIPIRNINPRFFLYYSFLFFWFKVSSLDYVQKWQLDLKRAYPWSIHIDWLFIMYVKFPPSKAWLQISLLYFYFLQELWIETEQVK